MKIRLEFLSILSPPFFDNFYRKIKQNVILN